MAPLEKETGASLVFKVVDFTKELVKLLALARDLLRNLYGRDLYLLELELSNSLFKAVNIVIVLGLAMLELSEILLLLLLNLALKLLDSEHPLLVSALLILIVLPEAVDLGAQGNDSFLVVHLFLLERGLYLPEFFPLGFALLDVGLRVLQLVLQTPDVGLEARVLVLEVVREELELGVGRFLVLALFEVHLER